MEKRTADKIQVMIGVSTRNRPIMLEGLLDSFISMKVPSSVEIQYHIVENNESVTINEIVKQFSQILKPPHFAVLSNEPRIGIPYARNMIIDASINQGCKWLVFVDDDEAVDPDWLVNLLKAAETHGFDLAGGPVFPLRPEGTLTERQEAIFKQLEHDAYRRLHARENHAAKGEGNRIDLATNNWIASVAALEKAVLRFDEAMRHMGGTDTEFSRRANREGLKLGWVSEAVVYEVVTRERLKLAYVFRRSRSQTLAKYYMRYRNHRRPVNIRCIAAIVIKGFVGTARFAFGMAFGTQMKMRGVRSLGIAAGYLQGIAGYHSKFYVKTDGY
jgi:GT2 family glycosyltransferase